MRSKRFQIFIVVSVIIIAYLIFREKPYVDAKYGFKINSSKLYYSLTTPNKSDKSIVSSFSVKPIKRQGSDQNKQITFKSFCQEAASEGDNKQFKASEVKVNNLTGYLCEYQAIPANQKNINKNRIYLLLNQNKNYDYIISVTFPDGNSIEETKVNKLVHNFFAL